MNIRPLVHKSLKSSGIALLALLTLGAGTATASSSLEEVWSFGGGAIAIQGLPNGAYQGTVVSPTTFAECPHPAGEVLWTEMRPQADGSFWGFHQWFGGQCDEYVNQPGPTAWRVLENTQGAHFLRVCFSEPGSPLQPTIAADGSHTNTTYGCEDSSLITSVPVVGSGGGSNGGSGGGSNEGSNSGSNGGSNSGSNGGSNSSSGGKITFASSVVLPSSKGCTHQNSLAIKLHDPKYDPFKEVVVKVGAKQVADVRGVKRLKSAIVVKSLPSGAYKVSLLITTVLEQHLSGSRTYQACTKASGAIKLHHKPKKHHHHR